MKLSLVLFFVHFYCFCSYQRFLRLRVKPSSIFTLFDEATEDSVEQTRNEVLKILESNWISIEKLIPPSMFPLCQEEIKAATSLLVLATLRRTADVDERSKALVESMFRAADVNADGDLTYVEWFEWLHHKAHSVQSPPPPKTAPDFSSRSTSPSHTPTMANSVTKALVQVFSHSLFALQVLSRIVVDNPNEYVSAFISGGIMSGILDEAICRTMLERLGPQTRELITFSLSVESASLPIALKRLNQNLVQTYGSDSSSSSSPEATLNQKQEKEDFPEAVEPKEATIETVDLASIPLLVAPPIFDDDSTIAAIHAASYQSPTNLDARDGLEDEVSAMRRQVYDLDLLFRRAKSLTQEITQLRSIIKDLDDKQASSMRLLMLKDYGKRADILRLAMTIRATRLQHANTLPVYARHQLAIDTLQLWAPLSFTLGVSNTISELEVHSYVLMFPRSFGSFIDWYGSYKPLAKALIEIFRRDLLHALKSHQNIKQEIQKLTIQSRLKTPSSAFKKMVRGAKTHHQLLDLAGIRIIVEQTGEGEAAEKSAVWRAYTIIKTLIDWEEEPGRFKDYVANPKPSGYQSIHLSLRHIQQGLNLEVQIRSRNMHNFAEYGPAAHKNYKALVLPPSK